MVEVLLAAIASPFLWEFIRYLIGFARKKEYLEFTHEQYVKDVQGLYERLEKQEQHVDSLEVQIKDLIKSDMVKSSQLIRTQLDLEFSQREKRRLQSELKLLKGGAGDDQHSPSQDPDS